MRAPTCLVAILVPLAACEPMADPGSPFEPVHVVPAEAVDVLPAALEPAPALDPLFPTEEPVVVHSSEMGKKPEAAPDVAPEADAVAAPEAATEPSAAPIAAAPAPAPLPAAAVGGGWPLRLVATVPGAQPPRAIIGLPGGEELVVTPGSMVPEAGVVVMAVGTDSVEIAEIRAVGDHAEVLARTLLSLQGRRTAAPAAP